MFSQCYPTEIGDMKWMPRTLDELGYVSRGRSRHRPRDAAHLYGGSLPILSRPEISNTLISYVTDYSQGRTRSRQDFAQSQSLESGYIVHARLRQTLLIRQFSVLTPAFQTA